MRDLHLELSNLRLDVSNMPAKPLCRVTATWSRGTCPNFSLAHLTDNHLVQPRNIASDFYKNNFCWQTHISPNVYIFIHIYIVCKQIYTRNHAFAKIVFHIVHQVCSKHRRVLSPQETYIVNLNIRELVWQGIQWHFACYLNFDILTKYLCIICIESECHFA